MAASGKGKGSSPSNKDAKGDTKPKARSRKSKSSPNTKDGSQQEQPKKRRRTSGSSKKADEAASKSNTTPSPTRILIVDNGGDTLKYGWLNSTDTGQPALLPNVTARLKHQWTILVGDELREKVPNPNQMYSITRSTERGVVTNLGNQVQVWKRMLDLLGVSIPNLDSEAAQAFGWKVTRANKAPKQQQQQQQSTTTTAPETPKIPASLVAVLLLVPPHCPRTMLDQMMYTWMEDLGVSHVGFATSQLCATRPDPQFQTGCLVDLGWSATHIVPTFRGRTIVNPGQDEGRSRCPIRRIPLGGRHLVNVWKYYASYRQWNLMDQEWILRDVFEQLGYVSLDFRTELNRARHKPQGRRAFDRNFVLPDYQTTFRGHVELPPALQREAEALEKQKQEEEEADDDDDDDDDDDFEDDKMEEDVELEGAVDENLDVGEDEEVEGSDKDRDENNDGGVDEERNEDDSEKGEEGAKCKNKMEKKKSTRKRSGKRGEKGEEDEEEDDDDSDDDSDEDDNKEMLRQRLLRQKQEEERRRSELEAEQQVLAVSVERFTVPEVLFHPSDAGLPLEMAGLAHSIVQSIKTCPKYLQPALFRSIQVTGGVSKLPNLMERLEREVRALAPEQFEVKISKAGNPIEQAWLGAQEWAQKNPYTQWTVSRSEWEENQKRKAWTKLLESHGGLLV